MRIIDIWRISARVLQKNFLRSLLTTGGIAVGIGAMVFLISLGLGLEEITIGGVVKSDALLTMDVSPGPNELKPLSSDTIKLFKSLNGVTGVWPRRTLSAKVYLNEKKTDLTVLGISSEFLKLEGTKLAAGRLYQDDDKQVMIVSSGFLRVFGLTEKETPLVTFKVNFMGINDAKENIVVNSVKNFSVVGVIEDTTAVVGYVPLKYSESLNYDFGPYEKTKIKVGSITDLEKVKENIVARGYSVITVIDKVEEVESVFKWIRLVLGILGVIAVAVASIGMFNTLTISFLERIREISIMKTLGATDRVIWQFFIWESLMLGFIGGILGIFIAYVGQQITMLIMNMLANLVEDANVVQLFYTPPLVVIEFILFSLFISFITGFYPALRAKRLLPIEAIRNE